MYLGLWMIGGVVDFVVFKQLYLTALLVYGLPWVFLLLLLFVVSRAQNHRIPTWHAAKVGGLFLGMVLLVWCLLPIWMDYNYTPHPHARIWSWDANLRTSYYIPGTVTWELTTDPMGFRNDPKRAGLKAGQRTVLFVGDSFFFGLFVNDGETAARQLESQLQADGETARVANAAIPGVSLNSHPGQVQLALPYFQPSVIVVHIKFDDLDPNDVNARRNRVVERPFYRLLQALCLETVVEAFRLVAYPPPTESEHDHFLQTQLAAIKS